MNKLLKEYDIFQGLEVTRTSDSYCFFGKKRIGWNTIQKLIDSGEKIQFKLSPNKIVEWSDREQVIEYHNSFKFWNTYISGYSNRFTIHSAILEVKDGLVFYNDEYYLPSPVSKWEGRQNWWNARQEKIADGKYNVNLLKQENDWYPRVEADRGNIVLNLFILGSAAKSSVKDLRPNSNELWASQYGDGINFGYERSTWEVLGTECLFI
jgi:hypothetical protein